MITKVKHSKGQTLIRWRDVKAEEIVEHELKSSEDPRPELLTSIAAFTPFVIEICEFPKGWTDDITVIGISLSEVESKAGMLIGIVITASKRLERSPLPMLVNTPFMVDEVWPKGLQQAVEQLDREAVRFRTGDRAQQMLPGVPKTSEAAFNAIAKGLDNLQKLADKDGTTLSLGVNGEKPKVIIRPRNGKHPEARV